MCPGALYYTDPDRSVFVVTRKEEASPLQREDAKHYFKIETFYDEYSKNYKESRLPIKRTSRQEESTAIRAGTTPEGSSQQARRLVH